MKYELQVCSPKARAKLHKDPATCNVCCKAHAKHSLGEIEVGYCPGSGGTVGIQAAPETGYPFVAMLPGQCFIVPFEGAVEKTIRNRVSVQNKVDERKFVVIKHSEFECYEVARVK